MAVSLFDSEIYRELMCDEEVVARFSDSAEVVSWLRAEAALAIAQGKLGIIPADSADAIGKACAGVFIEPASLSAATGRDGIPIPALIAALRKSMGDNEPASYLHFGATTQDIMDTGLVLRLAEICDIFDARLALLLQALADLADAHAELPVVARTRRMPAAPTSFGAIAAAWGYPLLAQAESLAQLRPRLLRASLAGAAGNSSALGPRAAELRAAFAAQLGLAGTDDCWHTDRSTLVELAAWITRVVALLARIAEDCIFASAPEVGELRLVGGGGSSTLPHKQNPVHAETLIALHGIAGALGGSMTSTLLHRQQRDGAAWMLEWHALPQLCAACGRALQLGIAMLAGLETDALRIRENLDGAHGLVYAEAISFRLAEEMPRATAQATVKELCADALSKGRRLTELAAERFPEIDWNSIADPAAQLGDAPEQARRFATRVRTGELL
jgi:3-carboxy-cis,cis-muconate cycloisomerase